MTIEADRYISNGPVLVKRWMNETVCIPPPFFFGLFLSPPQKILEYMEKLGKRERWWRWRFFFGSSTREDMWGGGRMGSVKGLLVCLWKGA